MVRLYISVVWKDVKIHGMFVPTYKKCYENDTSFLYKLLNLFFYDVGGNKKLDG